MTRALNATVAVATVLLLAGCANNGLTPSGSSIDAIEVKLLDGRVVPCVTVGGSSVACDWESAR